MTLNLIDTFKTSIYGPKHPPKRKYIFKFSTFSKCSKNHVFQTKINKVYIVEGHTA